ncbi:MAG: hypothetical protein ACXWKG_19030 [Limisphaerales bacterium]
MPPQAIQLGLFILEEAIKVSPSLIAAFQALFASGQPTAEDFAALRALVAGESYEKLVPNSALPAGPVVEGVDFKVVEPAPAPESTAAPTPEAATNSAPVGWQHPAN